MSYTLDIDPDIAIRAERYAKRNGSSVEAILKAYLMVIVTEDPLPEEKKRPRIISRRVHALRGAASISNESYKQLLEDGLTEDYEALR